jgi:hypothetical protein
MLRQQQQQQQQQRDIINGSVVLERFAFDMIAVAYL